MDDENERAGRKTPGHMGTRWHVWAWHAVLARAQVIIAVLLTLGCVVRIWKGL